MNIKKYQMSLKQYRAFYSVQCRQIKTWARMKDTVIVAIVE